MSTVKTTQFEPDIYDLRVRLCAIIAYQATDLEQSHSPVCLCGSLRITIALVAAFRLFLSLVDAVNSYQSNVLNEEQMSYIF